MIDLASMWDQAILNARAQAIATERVVPLRSDISSPIPLTPAQHRVIALQSLERAAMQLEMLGDDAADEEIARFLGAVIRRLMRRMLAYRLGLVSLAGKFGRRQ
jgi:hypothetical protein